MIIDVLLRDKEAQCDTAQKLMARTMISGQDQTIKSNQGLSVEISGVVHIDRALSPPSLISWSSGQRNHGRGIPNLPRKLLTLTTAYQTDHIALLSQRVSMILLKLITQTLNQESQLKGVNDKRSLGCFALLNPEERCLTDGSTEPATVPRKALQQSHFLQLKSNRRPFIWGVERWFAILDEVRTSPELSLVMPN